MSKSTPEQRLAAIGLTLPAVPAPMANYVPYRWAGNLLFLSGCSDKLVLGDIFVGLMGDVERAGAKHDAHSAGVTGNARDRIRPSVRPAAETSRHGGGKWRPLRRRADQRLRSPWAPPLCGSPQAPPRRRSRALPGPAARAGCSMHRERFPRKQAPVEHHFAIVGTMLSPIPPAMRVTVRLAWPTRGWFWVLRARGRARRTGTSNGQRRGSPLRRALGGWNAPPRPWRG